MMVSGDSRELPGFRSRSSGRGQAGVIVEVATRACPLGSYRKRLGVLPYLPCA